MFFIASFYLALAIFGLGLFYKVSTWFRYSIDTEGEEFTSAERVSAAIKGIVLTVFSAEILTLLKVLVLDVLLQVRIFRESVLRWSMHMCIFGGFMLLLLMHALDKFITSNLFMDYSSTLNPFLFLRNLFVAFVILGLAVAVYRRFILKVPRLLTNAMDYYAIIILAVIMVSGIFLEGVKIVSYTSYQSMVEDYAGWNDTQELRSLESYWVKEFGVVSPNLKGPFEANMLAQGKEFHEMSCAACHSRPQWAFMSYGVSKTIMPIAVGLDRADLPTFLWYIHFLACFIGLAYLPFSKMFHIFASPLSLLANAVMDRGKSDPANIATRQVMELDACTNCQVCADVCPAVSASKDSELSVVYRMKGLEQILKGRIGLFRKLFGEKEPTEEERKQFSNTVFRCTLCAGCQEVCPVGIRLKELWLSLRQDLVHSNFYPKKIEMIRDNLEESHNVFAEDNEERADWVEDMREAPDHGYLKDEAEVVYFTGCVAAYFPLAQKIPMALTEIMEVSGVDFTLLGEEEWCCGFPLLGAGLREMFQDFVDHNIEAVREKGARKVIFACPSCYQMWREYYPRNFEIAHATQFLMKLVKEGYVPLQDLPLTVTYHDPCDLGRGARVFDEPREVIRSIPGVKFVELPRNRQNCQCCGGGGNLEMIDAKLSSEIARHKIDEVMSTGAQAVVTACQQCVRIMTTYVRRNKVPIDVIDITQLIHRALKR